MTNDKLADEIERQLRNDGLRIQVDELSDASPHAAVHRRVQFAAPSWKQILATLRAERPQSPSDDIPLCAGHADWWFTSRNHLKGNTSCVVCAFNPERPAVGR